MALRSARFIGQPILEQIRGGDTSAYLRSGAQGDHVRAVQFALIDLGYAIPSGATGNFVDETSAAVVAFKQNHGLVPDDPVVGVGTMTALDDAWALPFADRDEWLSPQVRPFPEYNFSRQNELDRRASGRSFTINPISSWLPDPFKHAMLSGISELLDPNGSPDGALTPSATWGASPLDLFHCHVVVTSADGVGSPSWSGVKAKGDAVHQRIRTMMVAAEQHGREGTPPWTAAYRSLLVAPGGAGQPSFMEQVADVLRSALATSHAVNQTLKLVWHTFEHPIWRPIDVDSQHPRRSWWSDVAPVPRGVTKTPFTVVGFGDNVYPFLGLAFLIDQDLVVTVLAHSRIDVAALLNLDEASLNAAAGGPPHP